MNEKESFILYNSFYEPIKALKNEQLGKLLRAIFNYTINGEITQDSEIIIAFMFIKNQLDRDSEKWEVERNKRKEAGRLGGIKRALNQQQKLSSKSKQCLGVLKSAKQNQANQADNVDVNVDVYVNDNVNDNVTTNNNIYDFIEEKYDNKIFEKFWNEYPKKISKGNAEKWFKKNKPTNDLVDLMIEKLKIYKETEQWKKDNGKYIPYPSSWLNAKGWEDEIQSNNIKRKYDTSIVYHDKYIGDYKFDENGRRIFV